MKDPPHPSRGTETRSGEGPDPSPRLTPHGTKLVGGLVAAFTVAAIIVPWVSGAARDAKPEAVAGALVAAAGLFAFVAQWGRALDWRVFASALILAAGLAALTGALVYRVRHPPAGRAHRTTASRPPSATGTATTTPDPSASASPLPSAAPGPPGPPTWSHVRVGDQDYVDLDTRSSYSTPTRDAEIYLDLGRLYAQQEGTWSKTTFARVSDDQTDFTGCAHATDVVAGGLVHLDQLPDDQSVCVSTSKGNWAVVKPVPPLDDSSNGVTFDIWLRRR